MRALLQDRAWGRARWNIIMPLIYPDLSWSGRLTRTLRALQLVAVAGTIGVAAGAVGVLAVMRLSGDLPPPQLHADATRASDSSVARPHIASAQPAPAVPQAAATNSPATNPPGSHPGTIGPGPLYDRVDPTGSIATASIPLPIARPHEPVRSRRTARSRRPGTAGRPIVIVPGPAPDYADRDIDEQNPWRRDYSGGWHRPEPGSGSWGGQWTGGFWGD